MTNLLLLAFYSFLIVLHFSAGGTYLVIGALSLSMVLGAGLWRVLSRLPRK